MNAFTQFKNGSIFEDVVQLDNTQIIPRDDVEIIKAELEMGCGGLYVKTYNRDQSHIGWYNYNNAAKKLLGGAPKGYFAATYNGVYGGQNAHVILDRAPSQTW
jgi:hypothetical protein